MLLCVSLCNGLIININDSQNKHTNHEQNKHTNHEQSSSSMATRKTLLMLFTLLPDSQFLYSWSHWTDLFWLQWWELLNVCESATFRLSMLSVHRVLDQCAACTCVVHVLYTCVFCVIFCGMRLSYAQSHSNDSRVHATVPCSVCALAQAHSTMSSIRLVLVFPGNFCVM